MVDRSHQTPQLFEFSVVLIANDHNPTLLNPDFLARHGIVKPAWKWELVGTSITTPAFAMVQYANGVTIVVEPNKLQVTDPSVRNTISNSRVVPIVKAFVKILPHVRYSATGINFRSVLKEGQPAHLLKSRFLAHGPWDNKQHPISGFGLKFRYSIKGGQINLSLDSGQFVDFLSQDSAAVNGVIVSANFHRECKGYPASDKILEVLDYAKGDFEKFNAILADVFS